MFSGALSGVDLKRKNVLCLQAVDELDMFASKNLGPYHLRLVHL